LVHRIAIYTIRFRNNAVILDTGKNVWKVFSLKKMQVPDAEQKVGIKAWLHYLKQSVKHRSALIIDDADASNSSHLDAVSCALPVAQQKLGKHRA
jgi:hypothetical protein